MNRVQALLEAEAIGVEAEAIGVEAEATGVEAEAVDEIAASTSLIATLSPVFYLVLNISKKRENSLEPQCLAPNQ